MLAQNFHYGTVTEAINDFKKQGYSIDFNLDENCFVCDGNDKYYLEDFEISALYRYEGNSDPGDVALVCALESKSGLKGILVSGYGISADSTTQKMLEHLNYQKTIMMKFKRKAISKWNGSLKEGKGSITTESLILNDTPYSYKTRFEKEIGINPEELIGAAHSSCFTMQLSHLLGEAGFTPTHLETEATVTFENSSITQVHLELSGEVEGIAKKKFEEIALIAKKTCPVSKLLNAKITLSANLIGTFVKV